MANYQETTVAGTAYKRAWRVEIENGIDIKSATFHEEKAVVLDDGSVLRTPADKITMPFNLTNAGTSFPLMDPQTGVSVGVSMTYQDMYVAIYSLYLALATERDAKVALEAANAAP